MPAPEFEQLTLPIPELAHIPVTSESDDSSNEPSHEEWEWLKQIFEDV